MHNICSNEQNFEGVYESKKFCNHMLRALFLICNIANRLIKLKVEKKILANLGQTFIFLSYTPLFQVSTEIRKSDSAGNLIDRF